MISFDSCGIEICRASLMSACFELLRIEQNHLPFTVLAVLAIISSVPIKLIFFSGLVPLISRLHAHSVPKSDS